MTYWNYCDYRCEDCERFFECPVALKEREQEIKAIIEGREFDPKEAVKVSLNEAFDMVSSMAKSQGVDLDSLKSEPERERDFPVAEKTKKFALDVFAFAKNIEHGMTSEENRKVINDLRWYAGLLSVKLNRCLSGKHDAETENDPELREFEMNDAYKTAQIAVTAISECKAALNDVPIEYSSERNGLCSELNDIEKEFKAELSEMEALWINNKSPYIFAGGD